MAKVRTSLLILASAALLSISIPSTGFATSCPAPGIVEIAGRDPRAGETITLSGGGFLTGGCDDTEDQGGCGSSPDEVVQEPYADIELRLLGPITPEVEKYFNEGGPEYPGIPFHLSLAVVDANSRGFFRLDVGVPPVPPGRYYVTANGAVHDDIDIKRSHHRSHPW